MNSFDRASDFETNHGAWRAEAADFDLDGDLDLAMVNYRGGCPLHLYKNDNGFARSDPGDTNRSKCLLIPSPSSAPYQVAHSAAWGDYDNDGDPDLAVGHAPWRAFITTTRTTIVTRPPEIITTTQVTTTTPPSTATIRIYINDSSAADFEQLRSDRFLPVDEFITPAVTQTKAITQVYNTTTKETTTTAGTIVDERGPGLGYAHDLAWGDYNGDGDLDLAAAFSSAVTPTLTSAADKGGFRIYNNDNGVFARTPVFAPDDLSGPVGAVAWADFDKKSRQLELAVAEFDALLSIYSLDGHDFRRLRTTLNVGTKGAALSLRAVDYDNDGDLDLAFTNFEDKSWLFTIIAPFLEGDILSLIGAFRADKVVWGDIDGGYPDLLFGATNSRKFYRNQQNGFFKAETPFVANLPARSIALANVDGRGGHDVILGLKGQNLLYHNNGHGVFSAIPDWISRPSYDTIDLLFADVDQDNRGRPDLIVGNNGPNTLYMNNALQRVSTSPDWLSIEQEPTQAIAWGYYDADILPDFAAANQNQPVRIYRNTGFNGFTVAQSLPAVDARDVAWGDYDGDGDLDLAVGVYGQPNQLYQNQGGRLTLVWTFPQAYNTTSLAWGDWDNDGDLDLAVGNDSQFDQVYANLDSTPDQVKLALLWQSSRNYRTTDLAWGDYDFDGDLDLVISQNGFDRNSLYRNTYVLAPHLGDDFAAQTPLPRNVPYLAIARPGGPGQVFAYTRAAPSTTPTLTIPITFTLYDADGSRRRQTNQPGNKVQAAAYHYSLNGGGKWYPATIITPLRRVLSTTTRPVPTDILTTTRTGQTYVAEWRAGHDMTAHKQGLGDAVRFRITMIRHNSVITAGEIAGSVQRVRVAAASPPFRVRNTICIWPERPFISFKPTTLITPGGDIVFSGDVEQWDYHPQGITYTWHFDDGATTLGQVVRHRFATGGSHVVTLTVKQPPCPVTRPDFVTATVSVAEQIFLPVILKSDQGQPAQTILILDDRPRLTLLNAAGAPGQVRGLKGEADPAAGRVHLTWPARPPAEATLGYRVYQAERRGGFFRLAADIPAPTTSYTDDAAACGYAYLVTAYNAAGESPPSTASFYSPPCR